ncbi:hypothetical protein FNV43_RR00936 [Rhamnella rubrinervis]|uniref:CTLH domain-containing protein n=1 Tax=Rhamnella rubrinervis TaxID=2594499 RepID=A0A8K0HNP9_9ROSA|nr:hypothetical protein FNV43_RR00936 [Rhamnella rubrinervis]
MSFSKPNSRLQLVQRIGVFDPSILEEEKFKESVHKIEQESGFLFNMKYFEEKALGGEWEDVEKYLSGFTKVDDNRYSMKIFFEIRKQKYLEALDRNDRAKAVEILAKDLKIFSTFNEELYKEITQLLTLENFSLNWQHRLCKNPRSNPDIKTSVTDHTCSPSNGARAPTTVNLPVAALLKASTYAPLGAHGRPFPLAAAAPNTNALAGWMVNADPSSSVHSAATATAASSLSVQHNQASVLKHPRAPVNALGITDYAGTEHRQLIKRLRSAQSVDEIAYSAPQQPSWSADDLPRTISCTLHQGSTMTSMDFHPSHNTILAAGCANGEMTLWDVGVQERLESKPFKIWDMATCSVLFEASFAKDSSISISRVSWSPDGILIGVAFTKHLIHLYAIQGLDNIWRHALIQFLLLFRQDIIDAHVGGVNDLVFSHPNKQLCVVTCGDDKLIKVWDLSGKKLFNFEGHEAPVYSVCPHHGENIQFIFSTAVDGKIKAWLYDNVGTRVDYDAPGQWCSTMLYSADGSRLFSCATGKDGDTYLVEWNENNQIKFWHMDNINVLTSTDAEGGLPSFPRLEFNKEGTLLAVNTANNGLKVLANADGLRSLRAIEPRSYNAYRAPSQVKVSISSVVANNNLVISKVERMESSPARPTPIHNRVDSMERIIEKPRSLDGASDKTKPWELAETVDLVQCRVVTMPDGMDPAKKMDLFERLLASFTQTLVLVSLGSDGVQKLWKWSRSEQNPGGKATASVVPQHWQPNSGLLMSNDVPENVEEVVPCIALSKNDSYVMSACGGKVSLFNMMTFKVLTTFMPPPPASTFLAFHPMDNNIIPVGMEDSMIHIYNVRVDEVKTKLKGHQKGITGLAFSAKLNILVSAGADAQLCCWNVDTWDKRKLITIQMPTGKAPVGDTQVQFDLDQLRLLWVPQDVLSAPLTSAAYSSTSQLLYAAFTDGNIGVFDADSLKLRCRIAPSAYLQQALSNSPTVYPLVVTAHPQEPYQFAIGLTDGSVKVIEPSETEKWGVVVPADSGMQNARTVSSSTNNTAS